MSEAPHDGINVYLGRKAVERESDKAANLFAQAAEVSRAGDFGLAGSLSQQANEALVNAELSKISSTELLAKLDQDPPVMDAIATVLTDHDRSEIRDIFTHPEIRHSIIAYVPREVLEGLLTEMPSPTEEETGQITPPTTDLNGPGVGGEKRNPNETRANSGRTRQDPLMRGERTIRAVRAALGIGVPLAHTLADITALAYLEETKDAKPTNHNIAATKRALEIFTQNLQHPDEIVRRVPMAIRDLIAEVQSHPVYSQLQPDQIAKIILRQPGYQGLLPVPDNNGPERPIDLSALQARIMIQALDHVQHEQFLYPTLEDLTRAVYEGQLKDTSDKSEIGEKMQIITVEVEYIVARLKAAKEYHDFHHNLPPGFRALSRRFFEIVSNPVYSQLTYEEIGDAILRKVVFKTLQETANNRRNGSNPRRSRRISTDAGNDAFDRFSQAQ